MKFKENYLVFILFFLVMLSLGSVAASENVTSDEISNNDFVSLSVYSTLEVENDDVNTQETENEVSLETNNKKTRSSRDVLKVSNNSPLRQILLVKLLLIFKQLLIKLRLGKLSF